MYGLLFVLSFKPPAQEKRSLALPWDSRKSDQGCARMDYMKVISTDLDQQNL